LIGITVAMMNITTSPTMAAICAVINQLRFSVDW
jgi:hypothetical protein